MMVDWPKHVVKTKIKYIVVLTGDRILRCLLQICLLDYSLSVSSVH